MNKEELRKRVEVFVRRRVFRLFATALAPKVIPALILAGLILWIVIGCLRGIS